MSGSDLLSTTQTSGFAQLDEALPIRARLRAVYPPAVAGQCFPLGTQKRILGRQPDNKNDLCLEHATVSRQHVLCAWQKKTGQHSASDLGSHNGSALNGKKLDIEVQALDNNDVLRLGDVLLVYEIWPQDEALMEEGQDVSTAAIPGNAPAMTLLRREVGSCASDPSPVLIIGDTGTGKERLAAEIHRLSAASGQYLSINCAALTPQLIESQLFGHIKGAFTGATDAQEGLFRAADGGSLFLDEIGELPMDLQPKLLRVIQEGEVTPVGSTKTTKIKTRVLAATNRDLANEIQEGNFRRDLYARLALWEVQLPSLSARRGDILDWLESLMQHWLQERDKGTETTLDLSVEVAEFLLLEDWQENLRGLDRLVHHLGRYHPFNETIGRKHLPRWLFEENESKSQTEPQEEETSENKGRRPAPSKEELLSALEEHQWSIRATAKALDRTRQQIYRWLEKYNIEVNKED
ncbi:MAG: sigma 54-interacting transcriptional regulator [Myxococcota bacterium]|nr:sigma 54-interacting transcriptional regulator [Myxococcota bacterium]